MYGTRWTVKGWQNNEFQLVLLAIGAGVMTGIFAVVVLRLSTFVGVLVFFLLFFLIFHRASAERKALEKIFQASIDDSHWVVQNVLDQKGIPYSHKGSGNFILQENGVEISLRPYRFYNGEMYTLLQLIPHDSDSWDLIFSLRDKLDDAFRPRGLNQ
ncbi:MAG: hypothetical protein KC445_14925 [Anaerolineales bacterium]|nr:hypothetical protein [Anaerolineales bacterium]